LHLLQLLARRSFARLALLRLDRPPPVYQTALLFGFQFSSSLSWACLGKLIMF
jgi:hypothetical protein